ncbi:hypothetical protein IJ380_02205 [Candidatus Saccharibacteria bacterium]|nr:hypothetical protein [Candidatus Saccharibacteria bacterium]
MKVLKRFKWVIVGVVIFLIGLSVFTLVHTNSNPSEYLGPDITDVGDDYETLNDRLSSLLESASHKDYVSSFADTRYIFTSSEYLYDTTKPWWKIADTSAKNGASITAFASALSILSNRKLTPAAIGYVTKENNFWNLYGIPPENLYENLANYYGIFYRKLPVMNHNILDYYLDKGAVVIIRGRGKDPYGETGNFLLVYAGSTVDGLYYVSSPISENYRIAPISRDTVFSTLESSEAFYVLSGASSRLDLSSFYENFNENAASESSLPVSSFIEITSEGN